MNQASQSDEINNLIHTLENRRVNEFNSLKAQLRMTGESMKPVNLMKSAANELTGNKKLKSYLIQAGIGLAVTLLTKKLLSGTKTRKANNLVENIAEAGLNHLTANQATLIKIAAPLLMGLVINFINNRRKKS